MTPDDVIPAGNVLGEGVQWHADTGLWWTDIQAGALFNRGVGQSDVQRFAMPERLGSFAPIEGEPRFIGAFETGIATFDPVTGASEWLHRVERKGCGRRFNDGRVDRQGRFWAGTMVEGNGPADASLYRIDHDGALQHIFGEVGISNGLCWSPDGATMYFADSPKRMIMAFEFDQSAGLPHHPRLFTATPSGAYPDGATVDADGCVWSAQWGGARVVRYTPAGKIDRIIELPVSQPTCVAFAGDDLRSLTITTARDGLDAAALDEQPLAGDVLMYRVPFAGMPECRHKPYRR